MRHSPLSGAGAKAAPPLGAILLLSLMTAGAAQAPARSVPDDRAEGVTADGLPAPITDGVHPVTGRRIAQVMSHLGAAWLDRPERADEEAPDVALDAIGVPTRGTVADVGAGSGYFTVRLAERVGPAGRVYATDVQPQMLDLLRPRLQRAELQNVELVLSSPEDPRLPPKALDLALMVDVYHELAQPQRMMRRLRSSLKPSGRLVLLEYRKEDPSIPIRQEHKMSVAEVKAELEEDGYRFVRVLGSLPRQHILVFAP